MRKLCLVTCLFGLALSGCMTPYSEAPIPVNFPHTEQNKLQAAMHWESIGSHLAKTIIEQAGDKKIIYINEPTEKSKFNKALHTLLLSALVKNGVTVAKFSAAADVSMDINTQVLKFTKDRAPFRNSFGLPTLLTAGAWAISGVAASNTAATTAGVATGAGAIGIDAYNWFESKYAAGEIPQNEIIVTVTASNNSIYLGSVSNIYYIADSDTSLYASKEMGKVIKVTGDKE
ncbi:MAG: hypothetical protein PHN18_08705 [Sulfurospirillaceae bacterium]|nr:hypothetical protein [Sulfurospirillaceae bacterium]MDD2826811.1 hypothetical protein [Sulfurospirillaceae bacterium]